MSVTLDDSTFQKLFTSMVSLLDRHMKLQDTHDQLIAMINAQPDEEAEEDDTDGESGE